MRMAGVRGRPGLPVGEDVRGRGMRKGPENETRLQAPGRLVEGPTMQIPAGTVAGQITTSRIEAAS